MAMGKTMTDMDAAGYVPHSGRMVLLEKVIAYDDESITCSVVIRPDSLFVRDGRVGPWVGIEYMAQAIGAHGGRLAVADGVPVQVGFLLGTRSIDFRTGWFRVGQTLHVTAKHIWGDEKLMKYSCSIVDTSSGRLLQETDLSVYAPGEELKS